MNVFSHFLDLGKLLLVFITSFGKEIRSSILPYLEGYHSVYFFYLSPSFLCFCIQVIPYPFSYYFTCDFGGGLMPISNFHSSVI